MKLLRRFRSLFRRNTLDAAMREEMRQHIEEQTERNIAAGMDATEARYAAERAFGNVSSLQERARDARGWRWLNDISRDFRIGARLMTRERGFFLIAACILALGIGGVTAQFSVINSALIRGLPFPDPERLVRVSVRDPTWEAGRTRNPFQRDVLAWSREQKSFTGLVSYYTRGSFIVAIDEVPLRIPGSHVTGSLFGLLGVQPAMGRDFTAEDQRAESPRVTVISDSLWKSNFGNDPAIIGRAVRLNGKTATVVGVMPPGFNFPSDELWMPMFNEFPQRDDAEWTGGSAMAIGRLRPGVSLDQANAELSFFARRSAEDFPRTNRVLTEAVVEPLIASFVPRDAHRLIWVMTAAVAAVLLIACLNVMNMQFARATRRARELAVRCSLGASRGRLIRQMLAESLLLAVPAGAAGALLSTWAVRLYNGSGLPAWMRFELEPQVLLFTLAMTGGTVLLSGLLPALVASRSDPLDVLKAGGRGQSHPLVGRVTGALVVGQFALTAALLVATLLLIKSITNRYGLDFGYDTGSVLAGRINFTVDNTSGQEATATQRRLLERLRASPHFSHAALSSRRNNLLTSESSEFQLEGPDARRFPVWQESISDGYFATLGLRPLEGREFEPTDTAEKPRVALVNASFARKHLAGRSPLGARLQLGPFKDHWWTIVGVVPDTHLQGALEKERDGAGVFIPTMAAPLGYLTVVVRGHSDSPERLVDPLRRAALEVGPNLAVYTVETPKQALNAVLGQVRAVTSLFVIFAAVAIVLSAVGLYGVAAFSVGQRTQEFGVRMALGATPRQIRAMILRQGLMRLAVGGGLGFALVSVLARIGGAMSADLLYKVSPHDPTAYATVLLLLLLATLLACLIPANRATRVDPMVALRAE